MKAAQAKIEYGDFQTPDALAERICRKLIERGVAPQVVIEPTCGQGAFVRVAARVFASAQRIVGLEVNAAYLAELRAHIGTGGNVELREADFFAVDWPELIAQTDGTVLLLGNPPWVTNAVQGGLGSSNLPAKKNAQGLNGLDALTGKSNFDISEWMLMRLVEALQKRGGELAFICKTAVARKLLGWLRERRAPVRAAAIFNIDAARYFDVAVEACLLHLQLGGAEPLSDYEVFADLDEPHGCRSGWRGSLMVRDLAAFDETSELFGNGDYRWRSGIKHDCAEVLELKRNDGLVNGLGEMVEVEDALLYPLLKGSDVANGRIQATKRCLLVTQKQQGDDTRGLRQFAPQTWAYLEAHDEFFARRKSRIYRKQPRFAMFGVGGYSFAPWKVAICGLYKKLAFQLVGPLAGKPVVFDDTVYFLGCETRAEAEALLNLLQAERTQRFLDALIFWDEKRPVKAAVLNQLRLRHPLKAAAGLFD